MVTRLGYGGSVPQCEVAQGSRCKPFLQLIAGEGRRGGVGGGRAQLPDFRAASYSDPASVAQLEDTEVRLRDELPGGKGARRGRVRPGSVR